MGGGGSQSVRQSIDIKSTTSILEKNIQKNTQKVANELKNYKAPPSAAPHRGRWFFNLLATF